MTMDTKDKSGARFASKVQGAAREPLKAVQAWREEMVRRLLYILVVLGAIAVLRASFVAYQNRALIIIPVFVLIYAIIVLTAFGRKVSYGLKLGVFLFFFYALGVFMTMNSGFRGTGVVFYLTFTAATALLLGLWAGLAALVLSLVSFLGLGWLYEQGILVVPASDLIQANWVTWLRLTIIVVVFGALLVISERRLIAHLVQALRQSQASTRDLEGRCEELEGQVGQRSEKLRRQARYLASTAAVVRETSSLLEDSQKLLDKMVDLITHELGFYHTGVFLIDPDVEWANLVAASSEGGKRMLARRHRLRVGLQGIVGYVAASGRYRLASDVGADAVFFSNPDLPDTHSEIALPLHIREDVIGVLDVQSKESDAFSEEDVEVLQILADQVAMAINSARLFSQVQASAEAERRTYQQLSAEAWRELLAQERDLGFISSADGTLPAGDLWRPEMATALRERNVVVSGDGEAPEAGGQAIALPITVRGEVVGVIDGRKGLGEAPWTEDEIALIQAFVEQLQVALEGARLYRNAQLMALREQLIREITDEMGRAGDLASLMRITAEALNNRLGGSRIYVRLTAEDQAPAAEQVSGS